jgi:hypothetical protein
MQATGQSVAFAGFCLATCVVGVWSGCNLYSMTDARLWQPRLRINRVLRAMLHTGWSGKAWLVARVEFSRAFDMRSEIRRTVGTPPTQSTIRRGDSAGVLFMGAKLLARFMVPAHCTLK